MSTRFANWHLSDDILIWDDISVFHMYCLPGQHLLKMQVRGHNPLDMEKEKFSLRELVKLLLIMYVERST